MKLCWHDDDFEFIVMVGYADPNALFARAEQAYGRGDLKRARVELDNLLRLIPAHPAVLHLAALVAKREGRTSDALKAFRRALALAPDDAQIRGNFANLLGDIQRFDEALGEYEAALQIRPQFLQAHINRAILLNQLNRHEEAKLSLAVIEQLGSSSAAYWSARGANAQDRQDFVDAENAFGRAAAIDGRTSRSVLGLARAQLERGRPEAVETYQEALLKSPDDALATLGLANALTASGDFSSAKMTLLDRLSRHNDWFDGRTALAELLWEDGQSEAFDAPFREAIAESPDNAMLHHGLINLLIGLDRHDEAAEAAERAFSAFPDIKAFQLAEAVSAGASGDCARADRLFTVLELDTPDRWVHEARHRLRRNDFAKAGDMLQQILQTNPDDIGAWSLLDLVWRMTGDDRHIWLHGQPGLIATSSIEISDEDLAAAKEFLRTLHRTRAHPVGQSVRGGTQTRGVLFAHHDPRIKPLANSIRAAVDEHWAGLPDRDERHPLLKYRSQPWRFRGSWSVRFIDRGFHTSHVHPHGLLSSACYIVAPDAEDGAGPALEIGRPPADLDLALEPLKTVPAEPRTLTLFPSTLFHGTRPVSAGERMTVAFDIISSATS
ncbi:2OG-Fe(II) oxygenase family protein [Novosphingopyxis sp. YJ-S2-01]|uniref:2OG-Fe(II) oxygenase family protein n=1 Tax=Novosphingopyxis sp. YJ-S2-01 TaxID=2794021 RepID=UPI0018DCE116|nr:tetratricopeptide repeat protein [Novosphingopyxis sp. YJ-S2-01]MBH9536361.1 tetratricopeptide repeat protein [Novosphingopyxis sp. YJ-S2-01]